MHKIPHEIFSTLDEKIQAVTPMKEEQLLEKQEKLDLNAKHK